MSTKCEYRSGIQTFFDSVTGETLHPMAPVYFKDDFLGGAINTSVWTLLDTNSGGEALVANGANGAANLSLTNSNTIELAGLSWGDQLSLAMAQGLVFEAVVKFTTLPTGAVVAVIGLASATNAAVDNIAESAWFRLDGSGAVTVENDDGTHETSKIATGVTVTTADRVVLRIDCTDKANVKFFINGNQVAAGTTFNMSAANGALQPMVRIGKEAGATTVGTMQVDKVAAWQNRS